MKFYWTHIFYSPLQNIPNFDPHHLLLGIVSRSSHDGRSNSTNFISGFMLQNHLDVIDPHHCIIFICLWSLLLENQSQGLFVSRLHKLLLSAFFCLWRLARLIICIRHVKLCLWCERHSKSNSERNEKFPNFLLICLQLSRLLFTDKFFRKIVKSEHQMALNLNLVTSSWHPCLKTNKSLPQLHHRDNHWNISFETNNIIFLDA